MFGIFVRYYCNIDNLFVIYEDQSCDRNVIVLTGVLDIISTM